MKGIAAAIGVVFLSPFLIAGTAAMATAASDAQSVSCDTTSGDIDAAAVAKQVAAILGGKGAAANVHVAGLDLPDEQIPNAKTIVATGISLGVPAQGQVIALATAMQESRLRNLDYGDRDSLGLFQQRPSQGWGTPEQILNPVYAATKFYQALLAVHGWQQMTVTQAAQAVQRSGFPDAYAQWEPLARALQEAIAKTLPSDKTSQPNHSQATTSTAQTAAAGCAPGGSVGWGVIPDGAVPQGYTIPKGVPAKVRIALEWAMQQLGTPYQWGGACTDPHGPDPMRRCDCSSLVQQAYAHAGIRLPRTTYEQVTEGKPVSLDDLKPGDLLFTRGTAAAPEHVGIYMGDGLVINAPRTTKPVRIEPLKDWDVLAARRIVS